MLARVDSWAARNAAACLYFLAGAKDKKSIRAAEDGGFRLVDIRMTFEQRLDTASRVRGDADSRIRLCRAEDVTALKDVARVSHRATRFHADPGFPRARCDELYAVWIEQSCGDYADAVFVADLNGEPVGYVSCHLDEGHVGRIGLVGVKTEAQGRGLGRALVRTASEWFAGQGVLSMTVATQGCNLSAQRLYQKCGFSIGAVQIWFHKWLAGPASR